MPAFKNKSRLTVVDTVYYQPPGCSPTCAEGHFSRAVETDEQVWARQTSAGENWSPLQVGWVKKASSLLIINSKSSPGPMELADSREPVRPFAVIRPGESARFEPADPETLVIRCTAGAGRYELTLIPG